MMLSKEDRDELETRVCHIRESTDWIAYKSANEPISRVCKTIEGIMVSVNSIIQIIANATNTSNQQKPIHKGQQMTEFKLCKEMSLNVETIGRGSIVFGDFIKASEVEKMLQGGERKRQVSFYMRAMGSLCQDEPIYSDSEELVLPLPPKPKPLTKAEIIKGLKDIAVHGQESAELKNKLITRLESAGIE